MLRFFYVLNILILFFSQQSFANTKIVEKSLRYFKLSNEHTPHALEEIQQMLSSEVVYISNGVNGEFKKTAPVMEMMSGFFSKFPHVKWDVKGNPTVEARKVNLRFEMFLNEEDVPAAGTEIISFDSAGKIVKIEVIRDVIGRDSEEIKKLIATFELGLKERKAELACSPMDNDVLFVNQRGRAFIGRDAAIKRHKEILAKGGPLEKKPAAVYKFLRIDGSSANGNARALISWAYPSNDEKGHAVEFSDLDPQEGYFIANFLKKDAKWTIVTIQNTPTIGLSYIKPHETNQEL